jgi:hypothetical protein
MTFASSGNLRSNRPRIEAEQIWCELCNRPVDFFDESATHNLWGKPDASGNHRGYIMIRAYCHGQEIDIRLSFTDARANAGRRIVAFAAPAPLSLPSEPPKGTFLPLPAPLPLLLMDGRQHAPSI